MCIPFILSPIEHSTVADAYLLDIKLNVGQSIYLVIDCLCEGFMELPFELCLRDN